MGKNRIAVPIDWLVRLSSRDIWTADMNLPVEHTFLDDYYDGLDSRGDVKRKR